MKRNLAIWMVVSAIWVGSPTTAFAGPSPEPDRDAIDQIIDSDDHEVGEEMCARPAPLGYRA